MKTTKQKIEVMQAHLDGQAIESRRLDKVMCKTITPVQVTWIFDQQPVWNWDQFDYRVRLEPTIRPYTASELLPLVGKVVRAKANGNHKLIVAAGHENVGWVVVGTRTTNQVVLFEEYEFLDGSPCGAIENEQSK
jgi:hypothetical protein